MLSKNQISAVTALSQKKVRNEQRLFVAEGTKIVPELLSSDIVVRELFMTASFADRIELRPGLRQTIVTETELQRISGLSTPNEVLAVCEQPDRNLEKESFSGKLTLVLDDIRDPGNLGTIIRIADWFGISSVICSNDTVDVYNPKVVQSTMGSICRVKVFYTDLSAFLASSTLPVYGTLLEGGNIYAGQLSTEGFIVTGNESHGISPAIQKLLTHRITIPSFSSMKSGGEAESLNAAIATAIVCSEFRRRS
jgi:TrmH family RNA methyltransferase